MSLCSWSRGGTRHAYPISTLLKGQAEDSWPHWGGLCPELSPAGCSASPHPLTGACPCAGEEAAQLCCSYFHILQPGLLESRACASCPLSPTSWPRAGTPPPQVHNDVVRLLSEWRQDPGTVQGWLCSFPAPHPCLLPQLYSPTGEDASMFSGTSQ